MRSTNCSLVTATLIAGALTLAGASTLASAAPAEHNTGPGSAHRFANDNFSAPYANGFRLVAPTRVAAGEQGRGPGSESRFKAGDLGARQQGSVGNRLEGGNSVAAPQFADSATGRNTGRNPSFTQ